MLGKIIVGTLGGIAKFIGDVLSSAMEDCDKPNISGKHGPASDYNCSVCGMRIPRGAQRCPYCREQPDGYIK